MKNSYTDRKNIADILALTPVQEGMLWQYLENPESNRHVEQLCLVLSGKLEPHLFEQAWDKVIDTNEMLRTCFQWENLKRPVQVTLKSHPFKPAYRDFNGPKGNAGEKKHWLETVKQEDRATVFNLQEVPFRVTLCTLSDDEHVLIISNHHILYDGWSSGIILKEFFSAYHHPATNRNKDANRVAPPTKTKFKQFIQWLHQQDAGKQESFWNHFLADFKGRREEPGKRRRKSPVVRTGNYRTRLPVEMSHRIDGFLKSHNITIASLLYSAWGLLLQQYTQGNDVLFDTTLSGRSAKIKGIGDMVGLFINTLPLPVRVAGNETLMDTLRRVNETLRQREEFENTSPAMVNELMDELRQNLLFDSVVVIENYPLDLKTIRKEGQLSAQSYSSSGSTSYDLTVIIELFRHIEISITYNETLFDSTSIKKLTGGFTAILDDMVNAPQKTADRVSAVPVEERERLPAALAPIEMEYVYIAPVNETEKKLAGIWSSLLRVDKGFVGRNMNFFDFGGHSLKATLLAARIHKEFHVTLPLPVIFKHPTISGMADYINQQEKGTVKHNYIAITPAEKKEYYPLSQSQKRLYMLQQMDTDGTAYNGPMVMKLEGPLDKDRLQTAFETLIRRHESLRTSFHMLNEEPVQRIHDHMEWNIEFFGRGEPMCSPLNGNHCGVNNNNQGENDNQCGIDDNNQGSHIGRPLHTRDFVRPFDLSNAPLLRVGLIKEEETKHILMVDMHHIITDGTSTDIFTRELADGYNGNQLPPLEIQYKDFSQWQNERLRTGKLESQETFWLNHLSAEPPVLNMTPDNPRPKIQGFDGDRVYFEVDGVLKQRLKSLMKETRTTLYMVLLTVYNILLSRYTHQEDIVIGTPIAGRNHSEVENTIGFFLETIAIRNRPQAHKTVNRFLTEVKTITLEAYGNQEYPFRQLIKKLANARDLSRNPLIDVMLNVLNQDRGPLELNGINAVPLDVPLNVSKVDMTLEAIESEDKLHLELEYSTALFRRETMERFSRHFIDTLNQVVQHPGLPLSQIEIMSQEEKKQILEQFNDTRVSFDQTSPVHEWIEARAEHCKDRIAIVGNPYITYNELLQKSRRLATALKSKGVETGTIVALMVEPSVEMIIGILGIMMTGAAYLPIDPGYPEERVDFMLRDSGASVSVSGLNGLMVRRLGGSSAPTNKPTNLAYIIYTSGSTGKPKGVMVNHRNLTAYLNAFLHEFDIPPDDVVIQQASFSFDAFLEEVFPCLLSGARLAIPSKDTVKDTSLLVEYIQRHRVNIIDCSPLLLNELNKQVPDEGDNPLRSIHTFISGGDVLKKEYIHRLIKSGTVYNTYGPTETTICASYHKLDEDEGFSIPIGKPIANYQVYIMDARNRLLPIGIPGELCISGAGVTMGYLNRPELTGKKFELSPTLYHTGDLARWLPDGSIEYLGRIDRQVNIRGFRIELEEIENQLLKHEDIHQVAVLAIGNDSICAYFTAISQKTVRELRQYLALELPGYMIPAYFVQLERMPLT
ncbi:MAG: amino acid adenylation domain-containing protein, partial [bacterium]|nr:amino acid adenylation domain-containing protein [bacterium]